MDASSFHRPEIDPFCIEIVLIVDDSSERRVCDRSFKHSIPEDYLRCRDLPDDFGEPLKWWYELDVVGVTGDPNPTFWSSCQQLRDLGLRQVGLMKEEPVSVGVPGITRARLAVVFEPVPSS